MSNKICCKFHPEAALIEDYRAGDQICSACGLVVGDRVIDVGSEWRTFSSESGGEDKSRVGGTENSLLGSDLSTMIGPSPGGRGAGGSYSNMSSDAAIYTNRSRPQTSSTNDRALMDAFRTMSNMSDRINLPRTITDRANVLFKMVYEGRNLKGRSNSAIAAACLYIACRQDGVPRTFKEIVAVSAVSKKEIGRVFKLILKAHDTNVELITTGDFMSRFCGTLSLARPIQKAATCIAQRAVDLDIVPGRSPISVTAAAIYMASQASRDKRTQKEIADIAGVADVTIRQSYKLMLAKAKELFPADFDFVTPIENLPQC
eukprot:GFUD01011497.1.p1 GENE.GFUD01011497.1~~GFUD01011497.1.p1  ORF type:complete len:317 (-),score=76.64 GFUD01011497.1:52-1002(-)